MALVPVRLVHQAHQISHRNQVKIQVQGRKKTDIIKIGLSYY
jgi:hypothetical protein